MSVADVEKYHSYVLNILSQIHCRDTCAVRLISISRMLILYYDTEFGWAVVALVLRILLTLVADTIWILKDVVLMTRSGKLWTLLIWRTPSSSWVDSSVCLFVSLFRVSTLNDFQQMFRPEMCGSENFESTSVQRFWPNRCMWSNMQSWFYSQSTFTNTNCKTLNYMSHLENGK